MRHLSLVPTSPTPECAPERPVVYVPVKLLLAASGRCSCDECCRAALAPVGAGCSAHVTRAAHGQVVRNIHLLS